MKKEMKQSTGKTTANENNNSDNLKNDDDTLASELSSVRSSLLSPDLARHYSSHNVSLPKLEQYIVATRSQQYVSAPTKISSSAEGVSKDGNNDRITVAGNNSNRGCSEHTRDDSGIEVEKSLPSLSFATRFIRLNPRFDAGETLHLLAAELAPNPPPLKIPWLCDVLGFYAISGDFCLSKSKAFQSGRIYGMDVSSGAAVAALLLDQYDLDFSQNRLKHDQNKFYDRKGEKAKSIHDMNLGLDTKTKTKHIYTTLDYHNINDNSCKRIRTSHNINDEVLSPPSSENSVQEGLRVLDLCCAPGLKTCAIADILESSAYSVVANSDSCSAAAASRHPPPSTVIGVDISEHRMMLCKNIVKKYHIDSCTSGRMKENAIKGHAPGKQSTESRTSIPQTSIRLYCTDGTTFGTQKFLEESCCLVFESKNAMEEDQLAGKRKRMNKSARARQKKKLRQLSLTDIMVPIGPEVTKTWKKTNLCDAPCTKDCVQVDLTQKNEGINKKCSKNESDRDETPILIKRFDRVLVDVECSTDGSVRHLQHRYQKGDFLKKEEMKSSSKFINKKEFFSTNSKLTNTKELDELVHLQKRLILSGFRLLVPGGIMVYSTCSLAKEQNENMVSWLLKQYPRDSFLIPVSFTIKKEGIRYNDDMMINEGSIPGTVRFQPNLELSNHSNIGEINGNSKESFFGGGFFLAKIGKR